MSKNYKLEQHAYRELVKPKFYPKGTKIMTVNREGAEVEFPNALPIPKARKFSEPHHTKNTKPFRIKKNTREDVLRVEEIRHLHSLVRKGKV